jgi:hypothetical protein
MMVVVMVVMMMMMMTEWIRMSVRMMMMGMKRLLVMLLLMMVVMMMRIGLRGRGRIKQSATMAMDEFKILEDIVLVELPDRVVSDPLPTQAFDQIHAFLELFFFHHSPLIFAM